MGNIPDLLTLHNPNTQGKCTIAPASANTGNMMIVRWTFVEKQDTWTQRGSQ